MTIDARLTPLDAAFTTGQSFGFREKTPKTNVACTHCRRGCLAKREIIADERKYVQNFLVQHFPTVLLVPARSGSGKNPGDLLDKQRRRQIPEVVRAAPMLKNE
jgi:hypothetical protein